MFAMFEIPLHLFALEGQNGQNVCKIILKKRNNFIIVVRFSLAFMRNRA